MSKSIHVIRYFRKHPAVSLENRDGGMIQVNQNSRVDGQITSLSPDIIDDEKWSGRVLVHLLQPVNEFPDYYVFSMPRTLESFHIMLNRLTFWGGFHNFKRNLPFSLHALAYDSRYRTVVDGFVDFLNKKPSEDKFELDFLHELDTENISHIDILKLADIAHSRYTSICNIAVRQVEEILIRNEKKILFEAHGVVSTGIRSSRFSNTLVVHIAVQKEFANIDVGNGKNVMEYSYFRKLFQQIGDYDLTVVHQSHDQCFMKNMVYLCELAGSKTPNVQEFPLGINRDLLRQKAIEAAREESQICADIKKFLGNAPIRIMIGGRAELNKATHKVLQQVSKLLRTHPELLGNIKIVALIQETHPNAPGYRNHSENEIKPIVKDIDRDFPNSLLFKFGSPLVHGDYLNIMSKFNYLLVAADDLCGEGHNLHVSEYGTVYEGSSEKPSSPGAVIATRNMGAASLYEQGVFVCEDISCLSQDIYRAITSSIEEKKIKIDTLKILVDKYTAHYMFEVLTSMVIEAVKSHTVGTDSLN